MGKKGKSMKRRGHRGKEGSWKKREGKYKEEHKRNLPA